MADQTALIDPPETDTRQTLLSVDDAEIVRRVRAQHKTWQTTPPTQNLVKQIAIAYGKETGGRDTCAPYRQRRLRNLVQTACLGEEPPAPDTAPPVQTPVPEPTDPVQLSAPKVSLETADESKVALPDQTLTAGQPVRSWPVLLLALPAFVAVWSGWVGIGRMTGFGLVNLLPGLVDDDKWSTIDTAITLPIGVEAYAAYALWVWLSGRGSERARRFARRSAIGSLIIGAVGQIAYHLMVAAEIQTNEAPWPITMLIACLPVVVVGVGAGLAHIVQADRSSDSSPQGR